MNKVNITNEQVATACGAAAKLLSNDERVNCPPSMAIDGTLAVAISILTSLATGQAVLTNPPEQSAGVVGIEPAEDVALPEG